MLTPQDIADSLNAAGIVDRPQLDAFFAYAAALVRRNQLLSEIERKSLTRQASNQTAEQEIQALRSEITAIDTQLRGE